jgi:2-succinyl-5-enolpyruvyl-6-hydroxy-3-cyclohexene-1-carboxylate synthase
MTNLDLSLQVFEFLKQAQVKTVVVCAGARNAPLVFALQNLNFEVIHYFEERSSAFLALGLIKSSGHPVAVLTTSGTAVAELLPAAIEATYQGLPLILISADRPKVYRRTGAPQAIEQVGLFSNYVEKVYDLDVHTKQFIFDWTFQKPIQLNVCFDEPLIDLKTDHQPAVILNRLQKEKKVSQKIKIINPLIIVSEISSQDFQLVKKFLIDQSAMIYCESLSQLCFCPELSHLVIKSTDQLIKKAFSEKLFDSIIRIGGVPTLRFWRDLEHDFKSVPVYSFSELEYTGLSRSSEKYEIESLNDVEVILTLQNFENFKELDRQLQEKKLLLLQKYSCSEPAFVRYLSKLALNKSIYIGNSLPIRYWDSFAAEKSDSIYANRGANGIDGQISTYLGWSENRDISYCFIGDLTALYDLAALGLTEQLQKNKRRLVIMNNYGGQIFQRVFKNDLFINAHQIQFNYWAQMWNWNYQLVKTESDFQKTELDQSKNIVIEIQPDVEETKQFWNEWDSLCQKI